MGSQSSKLNASEAFTPVALEAVRYDIQTGLVPVVVQDADTGRVLMQAYANREALKRTLGTGQAWFWSRSRQEYWRKGATSGNVMDVREVQMDCDGDAVLYLVTPHGPACHTGATSCFYRTITRKESSSEPATQASALSSASESPSVTVPASDSTSVTVPASGSRAVAAEDSEESQTDGTESVTVPIDASILADLWVTLESRYRDRPQGSYTTFLFEHGVDKIAKKVGEEAVEVAIAAKNAESAGATEARSANPNLGRGTELSDTQGATAGSAPPTLNAGQSELASESADLLYHLLALWKAAGISPDDVFQVLRERHQ